MVSEVDEAAEKVIIETLLEAYPRHAVLAEESGAQHGNQGSDFVWIIDPLDGTSNYLHGFPMYAPALPFISGQAGASGHLRPCAQRLYTATKGRGAFLNEKRMRVSKRTQLQRQLADHRVWRCARATILKHLRLYKLAMQQCAGVRVLPLDLAFVAGHERCVF